MNTRSRFSYWLIFVMHMRLTFNQMRRDLNIYFCRKKKLEKKREKWNICICVDSVRIRRSFAWLREHYDYCGFYVCVRCSWFFNILIEEITYNCETHCFYFANKFTNLFICCNIASTYDNHNMFLIFCIFLYRIELTDFNALRCT